MIKTEWVCELCGMTERPCQCADAGKGAILSMARNKMIADSKAAGHYHEYDRNLTQHTNGLLSENEAKAVIAES